MKTAAKKTKLSTRERILRAAEQTMASAPTFGLRYAHVAKLAKVPQPLLAYHFPTPEILLYELVQRQLEKLKARSLVDLEQHVAQPMKALEAYIRAPFAVAEKDMVFRAIWTSFYHMAAMDKTFADLNLSIRNLGRERILTLVAMVLERQKGAARPIANLSDLTLCIQSVVTGYVYAAATETNGDFKRLADLAVQSVRVLIGFNANSKEN